LQSPRVERHLDKMFGSRKEEEQREDELERGKDGLRVGRGPVGSRWVEYDRTKKAR
jgi:hypothetical protein